MRNRKEACSGVSSSTVKRAVGRKFQKRQRNFRKKANEINKLCGADVFTVLKYRGKYYVYKSNDDPAWSPTLEQIVSPRIILRREKN